MEVGQDGRLGRAQDREGVAGERDVVPGDLDLGAVGGQQDRAGPFGVEGDVPPLVGEVDRDGDEAPLDDEPAPILAERGGDEVESAVRELGEPTSELDQTSVPVEEVAVRLAVDLAPVEL